MKKIYFFIILFHLSFLSKLNAQIETVILYPSKDAAIGYHDNYNTAGNNYGTAVQNAAYTIPGTNGGLNKNRALIDFDLSNIPANATVISAKLSLYATGPLGTLQGHTGTNNQAYLQRVINSWQENTVTWNNQPSATSLHQVILPSSSSSNQDYLGIDVTELIVDMRAQPSSSYGFLLRLVNEVTTNALLFYSKDASDSNKHPKLEIIYSQCPKNYSLVTFSDAALGYHDNYNTAGNNYGTAVQNAAYTIPGASGGLNVNRALINFDLTALPANAKIISAKLNLYATGPLGTLQGHTGTNNQAYLQRVTTTWNESIVTWNSQPSTTSKNQVILPASTSSTQDYLNIDVTELVKDMKADPVNSFGFMLKLVNETPTNALLFYSKNASDPNKHPVLQILAEVCDSASINSIKGFVFRETNSNCIKDQSEVGLENYIIKAQPGNYFTVTDINGNYTLKVDTGTYSISVIPPKTQNSISTVSCPQSNNYSVTLKKYGIDTTGFNFGATIQNCSLLSVDISSGRRRRCFRGNTTISYCNRGSADANNVKIMVIYPQFTVPVSSQKPWALKMDSLLVFDIGTVSAGSCQSFTIVDSVICWNEGVRGLAQCTKAIITPKNACETLVSNGIWDKSSIKVTGKCINNVVVMNITNDGSNMADSSQYRVYLNNTLVYFKNFKLFSKDSLLVKIPGTGQTIRLEADQRPGHPGKSRPRATVEVCGNISLSEVARGFALQVPEDNGNFDSQTSCLEIIDSFDPNDKQVIPEGTTAQHYISKDTDLEYLIRFQNTGTDTAYNIVVTDTLSEFLDITSFVPGGSSHPYTWTLQNRSVNFNFKNINLPDSTTNNEGSNGFIKYKISQLPSLPKGTTITNKAYIFFDFNSAIITNETVNTVWDTVLIDLQKGENIIEEKTIVTSTNGILNNEDILIYPNPAKHEITISGKLNLASFSIFSVTGQKVTELVLFNGKNSISLNEVPNGMYFYKILDNSGYTKTGKIIINK